MPDMPPTSQDKKDEGGDEGGKDKKKPMSDIIYEVNLQQVIEKYVLKRFKEDMGFLNRLLFRKSKHQIDIRWGYVDFQHKTTSKDRPLPPLSSEKHLDLFKSEYENETSSPQTYTFSASRETTASTSIEIQDSYTLGAETNLEVDLGGIVKLGGGVSGEKSKTSTSGQQNSKTQSWNIDTEISVPKHSRAIATLEVKEVSKVTDFKVVTTVSLPKGKLPVSIRRIDDNTIVKTYWIENLSKIFPPGYIENSQGIVEVDRIKVEGKFNVDVTLKLTSHGVCKSVSGKEQSVKVEYKELSSKTAGRIKPAETTVLTSSELENEAGDSEESGNGSGKETDVMIIEG